MREKQYRRLWLVGQLAPMELRLSPLPSGRSIITKKGDGSQVKESTDSSTTIEEEDVKGKKKIYFQTVEETLMQDEKLSCQTVPEYCLSQQCKIFVAYEYFITVNVFKIFVVMICNLLVKSHSDSFSFNLFIYCSLHSYLVHGRYAATFPKFTISVHYLTSLPVLCDRSVMCDI